MSNRLDPDTVAAHFEEQRRIASISGTEITLTFERVLPCGHALRHRIKGTKDFGAKPKDWMVAGADAFAQVDQYAKAHTGTCSACSAALAQPSLKKMDAAQAVPQ